MATTRGCLGKVKILAAATGTPTQLIGELTDWSFEETADQVDTSIMGACVKKFDAGAKATTGQLTTWWDADATGQAMFVVGNVVSLAIYPGGSGSGANFYRTPIATGGQGATITSLAHAGNGVDGTVGTTLGYSVNGSMTATAVP